MTPTILIADDERLEREALTMLLDTELADAVDVVTAATGKEAASIASDQRVDLALLDIRMPGLSGLEVAGLIRTHSPDAAIVFISAYDYFEYAQQAIRLRAQDYLIKPIDDDAVIRVARAALLRVRDNADSPIDPAPFGEVARFLERELLRDLLSGALEGETLARGLRLIGHGDTEIRAVIVREPVRGGESAFDRRGRVGFALESAVTRLVPRREARTVVLRHLGEEFGVALVVGAVDVDDSTIGDRNRVAVTAPTRVHAAIPGIVGDAASRLAANSGASPAVGNVRSRIVDSVSSGERDSLEELAMEFWLAIPEPTERPGQAQSLLVFVAGMIEIRAGNEPTGDNRGYLGPGGSDSGISFAGTTPPVDAQSLARRLRDLAPEDPLLEPRGRAIADWIDANFPRAVGLADLARAIGISESHCSRECVSHLGSPFVDLIRRRRIKEAKQLLSGTSLRIHEIAQRAGYRDGQYLARVFRDATGVSPGEWRRRYTI